MVIGAEDVANIVVSIMLGVAGSTSPSVGVSKDIDNKVPCSVVLRGEVTASVVLVCLAEGGIVVFLWEMEVVVVVELECSLICTLGVVGVSVFV